jgi:hypothetical protein
MITVGLSQHEIDRIVKILEENSVSFQVGATESVSKEEESEDTAKDAKPKSRGQRGHTAFYQIEIPQEEYEKLPPAARLKLEGLGIYPEMEAPNFDEVEEYQSSDATAVRNKLKKMEKPLNLIWVFIIVVGFIFGMVLKLK